MSRTAVAVRKHAQSRIGPDAVPMIRDETGVKRVTELAVLSAMVRGQGAAAGDVARGDLASVLDVDEVRAAPPTWSASRRR